MPRSTQVAQKSIPEAKLALKRNGFPSQKAFAVEIGISRATVTKFFNGKPIDHINFVEISEKLELDWQEIADVERLTGEIVKRQDWGEAPDISIFYGRNNQLADLKQWIIEDKCRLVTIFGMEGIGKTSLSVKLAQEIKEEFDFVIYRSLNYIPQPQRLLADLLHFLSNHQSADLPDSSDIRVARLLEYLRNHRCLLLLDDVETILASGELGRNYLEECQDYAKLFKGIGESPHKSCLVLISQEKPRDISSLEDRRRQVRSFLLEGLEPTAAQEILAEKGLSSSEEQLQELITLYQGNPLHIKIVATRIKEVFGGNISDFLGYATLNFRDINDILEAQFQRLSAVEQDIIYWLAIERQPVSYAKLRDKLQSPGLTDALISLMQRSLIEKISEDESSYYLQRIVMLYVTQKLINTVSSEIYQVPEVHNIEELKLLRSHDFLTEDMHLLRPIVYNLYQSLGSQEKIVEYLNQILSILQEKSSLESGYAAKNASNILEIINT